MVRCALSARVSSVSGPAWLLVFLLLAGALACKSGGGTTGSAGSSGTAGNGAGTAGSSGTAGNTGTGGSDANDGAVAFSRAELLAAFGACATGQAREFRDAAAALDTAVAAWGAAGDDASRAAARDAFRVAMDRWQVIELMQFGPTASATLPGGKDFRPEIYSWPLVNRCTFEEQIVARAYESPQFLTVSSANMRGLAALEYLLLYEGTGTACSVTSPALAGWMQLSAAEIATRKRAYAVVVARDVAMRAVGLDAAWDPAAGNFTQTLRTAGAGSPIYASTQDALNQVSDALFYIEGMVKDRKLAPPLGLNIDLCTSEICPELRESLYGRSKVNLLANVDGLRRVVEGCGPDYSGFGFDDLLVAVGSPVVAETLRMRAAAIRPAIEAVEEPDLDLALVQDKASVRAVYDAFKGVTDILKVDFATILDLELPAGILGDVD